MGAIWPNQQPHHCLLNHLFRRRLKKTSKLRVTGLCVGNSPWTGEFPTQMASNAENVSIWWRHHGLKNLIILVDICLHFWNQSQKSNSGHNYLYLYSRRESSADWYNFWHSCQYQMHDWKVLLLTLKVTSECYGKQTWMSIMMTNIENNIIVSVVSQFSP